MAEKYVQKKIIEYVKYLSKNGVPIDYERRQAGTPGYKIGSSDIFIMYCGLHIEVEIKDEGIGEGGMSISQEKRKAKMASIYTPYICVDSFDQFKSFVNKLSSYKMELQKIYENLKINSDI